MEKVVKGWKDIDLSETAKKALVDLKEGQVLALRMKHVNSSIENLPKIQVEFAQKINTNEAGVVTAATIFNAKDDRFSQGAQRCWETMDESIAIQMFGEIPEGEASKEILDVLKSPNKEKYFAIQVQEIVESELSDSEQQYSENYLKRAGADGNYFLTPEGERVATRRRLVLVNNDEEVPHTYLKGSFRPEGNISSIMNQGSKSALSSDVATGA